MLLFSYPYSFIWWVLGAVIVIPVLAWILGHLYAIGRFFFLIFYYRSKNPIIIWDYVIWMGRIFDRTEESVWDNAPRSIVQIKNEVENDHVSDVLMWLSSPIWWATEFLPYRFEAFWHLLRNPRLRKRYYR